MEEYVQAGYRTSMLSFWQLLVCVVRFLERVDFSHGTLVVKLLIWRTGFLEYDMSLEISCQMGSRLGNCVMATMVSEDSLPKRCPNVEYMSPSYRLAIVRNDMSFTFAFDAGLLIISIMIHTCKAYQ